MTNNQPTIKRDDLLKLVDGSLQLSGWATQIGGWNLFYMRWAAGTLMTWFEVDGLSQYCLT